jgi:spermidine synthase
MSAAVPTVPEPRVRVTWIRWAVYICFFLSGATALVFEVLWSREFVTVFGNSSYAISIVLCAYMSGLGLGSLIGGKVADRITQRLTVFAGIQAAVGILALTMPLLLAWVRGLVPTLSVLSPESLLVSTLARFGLSFAILAAPCFLMGTTLPLLVRAVTLSSQSVARRVALLYGWNTVGAALGCVAAGFWMLDTLGMRLTNLLAVGINVLVAIVVVALGKPLAQAVDALPANGVQAEPTRPAAAPEPAAPVSLPGLLLLVIAFGNGLASLVCEVLWFRYLAFLNPNAYVFPTILGVYLLGLGLGGFIYGLLARNIRNPVRALAIIELLLGIAVLATFAGGALVFAGGPPRPLGLTGMTWVTVFVPTVLMGMAFPLLCSVYGRRVSKLGERVGLLFAVNTVGTVVGSLLPIFVLVPVLGIQRSLLLGSLLYGGMGLMVLACGGRGERWCLGQAMVVYGGAAALFMTVVPSNLCQGVFLATDFNLGKHTEILFYREGRTGTAIVARDRANNCKTVYINGISEVPVLYAHKICFKLLGDLGPMLHPDPQEVLMLCFGGGIAAGATATLPEVKSITIVDLERSVVMAARLLAFENNGVLRDPKARIVIEDGRNYIAMSNRKWPVIISDSTHPKSADSWVLYTREFYQLVRDHLADDGLFVEWVPRHGLRTAEFKIIARTFQSVFPHSSLWVAHGVDEQGQFVSYALLVATPKPLSIDVARLRDRLSAGSVWEDLAPYGLQSPAGFLDSFICAEDNLQQWIGPGPINTDDLPYTQYDTRYSKSAVMDRAEFLEPMEDIWPWLTHTGSEPSAKQLREEITLRLKANRLALAGRFRDSFALLPDDNRYWQMARLYDAGPTYVQTLMNFYWDNPEALIFLAETGIGGPGGPSLARSIYERVLKLDPMNVNALNALAPLRAQAGDLQAAEDYLRRALHRDSRCVGTHYNLGLLLEKTGRHDEALEHWHKAAVLSRDAKAANQWGICLAQQGRVAEATQWFRRAVEIRPTYVPARVHLAYALQQTGSTQEALAQVRYILKLDPENAAFLNLLARLEGRSDARAQP